MSFATETRHFIRCDTCPDDPPRWPMRTYTWDEKDLVVPYARADGWSIRDDLHRCPRCVRENRTEMAS